MSKEIATTKIAIFRKREIRKIIHKNEWWFSVIDIVEALTGTNRGRKYWSDLKKKLIEEGYGEVSEKIGQLKMIAPDGKLRLTDRNNVSHSTIYPIPQSRKTEPPTAQMLGFRRNGINRMV